MIEAMDSTHILMDTRRVLNPLSHIGNSLYLVLWTTNTDVYVSFLPTP